MGLSYTEELEAWGKTVGSDGCTVVPEFFRVCCLEHDRAYATGKTLRGVVVTKADADQRFRDCIQRHSTFRWLSPLSWWRWWAVRQFGRGVWATPPPQTYVHAVYDTQAALQHAAAARRQIVAEWFGLTGSP